MYSASVDYSAVRTVVYSSLSSAVLMLLFVTLGLDLTVVFSKISVFNEILVEFGCRNLKFLSDLNLIVTGGIINNTTTQLRATQLWNLLVETPLNSQSWGEEVGHIQSFERAEMTGRRSEPQEICKIECRQNSPANIPSTVTSANLSSTIAIDGSGNVYIACLSRHRLRSPASANHGCNRD